MSKLDYYQTAVSGDPTYKMTKKQAYIFGGIFVAALGLIVYLRFIKKPSIQIINFDKKNGKSQVKLSNSEKVYMLNAGNKLDVFSNFKKYTISLEAIKDSESELIIGVKAILLDSKGQQISETIKNQ